MYAEHAEGRARHAHDRIVASCSRLGTREQISPVAGSPVESLRNMSAPSQMSMSAIDESKAARRIQSF